ncbi:MAG: hypothetical protein ABWY20_00980 [Mycobacterium sp.]
MRTHVRVTAAALIVLCAITGCERTTPGTVAMTTEPGPPLASPSRPPTSRPGLPIPGFPLPTRNTDIPEVPAPPNALTMKCDEFLDLDEATKLAVVRAILAQENNPLAGNEEVAQLLAEGACQFLPDATVNGVLAGGGPP